MLKVILILSMLNFIGMIAIYIVNTVKQNTIIDLLEEQEDE